MRLKSIELDGYRSVRDTLSVHVQRRLTCLIGANEAGKSTVLRAVALLREGEFEEFDQNTEADGRRAVPRLAFTLHLNTTDKRRLLAAVDEDLELAGDDAAADARKKTRAALKGFRKHSASRKAVQVEMTSDGARRVRFGSGYIRVDPPHSNAPTLTTWFNEHLPAVVLFGPPDELVDEISLDELETRANLPFEGLLKLAGLWERRAELFDGDVTAHRLLEDGGKRLTREVKKTWSQGSKVSFVLRATQGARIAVRLRDPGTFNVPSARSLGFRSFFSFYLALYAETEETEPEGFILLFDEPGLHLHPQGQKDLLAELRRLSERNQIIYATHSPFLLDRNDVSSVLLVSKGTTKKEQGTRITYKPYGANWRSLTSALGIVPADAFFPPDRTLLVEGSSDRIYIGHYMATLANELRADLNYLSIVDADRRDELPGTVRLLLGADRTIIVAADADQGGDDLRKRLKKLAGSKRRSSLDFIDYSALAQTDRPVAIEDLLPRSEFLAAVQTYVAEMLESTHVLDRDEIDALAVEQPVVNATAEHLVNAGVLTHRGRLSKTSIAAAYLRQDPGVPGKETPMFALCREIVRSLQMGR